MIDWTAVSAIVSAVAALLAAGAAYWSAAAAASSNKQAARERRTVLEREATRALSTVPAAASRVVMLADRLELEYTTFFALAGRNVAAAAPHKEKAAVRRQEAELIVSRLRAWLPRPVARSSDSELEALVRATDGFSARLEEMAEWLASDLRSVEEQIRPLRERALSAHERNGPS